MLSSSDMSNTSCFYPNVSMNVTENVAGAWSASPSNDIVPKNQSIFFFVCNIFFVCSLDYVHRHCRFLNSTLEIVAVYLFMRDMGIFFVIKVDLAAAELGDEDHLGPLTIFIPPKGVMQ